MRELQKKLQQVELDFESNKQQLEQANKDLEEKEKALTNVSNNKKYLCKVLYGSRK